MLDETARFWNDFVTSIAVLAGFVNKSTKTGGTANFLGDFRLPEPGGRGIYRISPIFNNSMVDEPPELAV